MGGAVDLTDAPARFRLAAAGAAAMPREIRLAVGKRIRSEIVPVAVRAYSRHPGASETGNRLPFALLRSMKVTARSGIVTGFRFGSTRKMRGGASLNDLARGIEFGSFGGREITYTRRYAGGQPHTVRRTVGGAFDPKRPRGRVIWPATYDDVAPRVIALWIDTINETIAEGWA